MQLKDHLDDIARSTGFLSRLPMPAHHFQDHDGSLSRAVGMFPVAGILVAAGPGLAALFFLSAGANAALTALTALILLIAVTGALHEDGLADSADAFGARRGRDHMLEIMKDSRTGSYGVLALISSFALRATALTILFAAGGGWSALLIMLAVAAASRAAMVWHWHELPPARQDGVAASVGAPEDGARKLALVLGGALFFVLAGLSAGALNAALALGVMAAAVGWWTSVVRTKLNGHTGDTIGASQQIAETVALLTLALLA